MSEIKANAINWFEIPVGDINRAKSFYEQMLDSDLEIIEMNGMKMAFLPYDSEKGGVGGSIVQSDMHIPSESGSVVYLNGGDNLQQSLDRAVNAGGHVVMPKTKVNDDVGYIAMFKDSEGNRVALHSPT